MLASNGIPSLGERVWELVVPALLPYSLALSRSQSQLPPGAGPWLGTWACECVLKCIINNSLREERASAVLSWGLCFQPAAGTQQSWWCPRPHPHPPSLGCRTAVPLEMATVTFHLHMSVSGGGTVLVPVVCTLRAAVVQNEFSWSVIGRISGNPLI
jgi:hypothetical protein